MPIIKYFLLYFSNLLVFLAIDFIWLSLIAQKFYQQQIGFLLTTKPNYLAAAIFYLAFVFASLFLVSFPLASAPVSQLILHAAVFGFITYTTYDLTNLATIKDWPLIVTVVDIAWGTLIGIITGLAGRFFINLFLK